MDNEDDVSNFPQRDTSDSHEHRLQRLEDELSELKVQNAQVSTNLQHLGVQVELSTARISDKIDLCVKPLADTLHEHIKEDAQHHGKLNDLSGIVVDLEAKEDQRAKRWAGWKKAIGTLFLGAGAIGMKELIVYLVHTLR